MTKLKVFVFTVTALTVVSIVTATHTYKEVTVTNGGIISGVVKIKSPLPAIKPMPITKDVEHCGKQKTVVPVHVGKNNGVANAIVYLENVSQGKKFDRSKPVIVNQEQCDYVPKAVVVPLGSQFTVMNSDPVLHTIHGYDFLGEFTTRFNIAQPVKGQKNQLTADTPGFMLITCDAGHDWMSAYVAVAPHPYYAITNENGEFELTDVPAGSYKVTLFHNGLSRNEKDLRRQWFQPPLKVSKEVKLQGGSKARLDFEL